jgi:hypothetical protein
MNRMNTIRMNRLSILSASALAVLALSSACTDSTSPNATSGTMAVKLTDAPFLGDSVKSVDIFVVRVDGRLAAADSAAADSSVDNASAGGWQALATPNASYNLLAFQNGVSTTLGSTSLAAGTYNGFRFIIDPTRSSVTLKNGTVLTGSSSPNVSFPSASRSGIKIVLAQPVTVAGGGTTTLLVDFDVNNSFVMRGNTIAQNGLLFKPVIRASVTADNSATNATVRLVNSWNTSLALLQGGTALSGGSNIPFGSSSACASVNASTPGLTVVQNGTTTPLAGFAPTLQAGSSYSLVAYPTTTGAAQFATLSNTFTPAAGQTGLRVFNATSATTGYDLFVTASGAALTTPTVSNTLSGSSSAFVSVPAGSSQLRVTTTGGTTTLLDLGSQTFTAGQNATLIIAPPATGTTALRGFLVTGC